MTLIKTLAAANQSERVKLKIPRSVQDTIPIRRIYTNGIPRSVQDTIPIRRIYTNGIWEVGRKHSRSWKLTDVNYIAASQETQKSIFKAYCGALNSLPTDATAKITIVNHRLNPAEFERRILLAYKDDWLDHYREEANRIMIDRAAQSNNLVQERFVTLSIPAAVHPGKAHRGKRKVFPPSRNESAKDFLPPRLRHPARHEL